MSKARHTRIPREFPVRPLKAGERAADRVTCGTCGLSWDDAIVTGWTPAPSARCPFESFHVADEAQSLNAADHIYRERMIINAQASYTELIQLWKFGHRQLVIDNLMYDHAGLTALFMAQGMADGRLTPLDLNIVANLLIEQRQRLCQRLDAQS